jgi:hypothetical protein
VLSGHNDLTEFHLASAISPEKAFHFDTRLLLARDYFLTSKLLLIAVSTQLYYPFRMTALPASFIAKGTRSRDVIWTVPGISTA